MIKLEICNFCFVKKIVLNIQDTGNLIFACLIQGDLYFFMTKVICIYFGKIIKGILSIRIIAGKKGLHTSLPVWQIKRY